MRWVLFALLVLALASVSAIDMDCPSSVEQGENIHIRVLHDGATQVRLYHHSSWHIKQGHWNTWDFSETDTGPFDYYGGAHVGGEWIGGGSDFCTVTVNPAVPDTPGTMSFSVSPSTIELGDTVTLSASFTDVDGTNEIAFYHGSSLQFLSNTGCYGTYCTHSDTHTPTSSGSLRYTVIGYDTNGNPTEQRRTIYVTGATVPTVTSFHVTPNPAETNQQVSFTVTADDDGNDLDSITVYFGNGQTQTQTCGSSPCTKTFTYAYATSGTKQVYATATDGEHTGQSSTVNLNIQAPSDTDGDGVPDVDDECPGTPLHWRPVVTTGSYRGCACQEIINLDPDPTDDGNPCTDDTCSIQGGAFVPVNEPFPDYSQPEGYVDGCEGTTMHDYYCLNGIVQDDQTPNSPECGGCISHDHQACWNGDPYWYDSCDNREQPPIDECAPGEVCVEYGGAAYCQGQCVGQPNGASCNLGGAFEGGRSVQGYCYQQSCVECLLPGHCLPEEECISYECVACTPDCAGKECGDDGCGDFCGWCYPPLPVCLEHACVECVASNDCSPGEECILNTCVCQPSCAACGDPDGCGGYCDVETCTYGSCEPEGSGFSCQCTPSCAGRQCGDLDGCGSYCDVESCTYGSCEPLGAGYGCQCTPTCAGRECGDSDGCGAFCDVETCPPDHQCASDGNGGYTCVSTCVDHDGDGYTNCEDCDDANPLVNPGATEVCDVLDTDEDCDGLADEDDPEGAQGEREWFLDHDNDGYPRQDAAISACDQPVGYRPARADGLWDCLDSNPDVNPATTEPSEPDALESCDGLDNDCDGGADNQDPEWPVRYWDEDGDGYGSGVANACTTVGVSLTPGDCDDTDPDVHPGPGRVEMSDHVPCPENPASNCACSDGQDNDCDGSTDVDDSDCGTVECVFGTQTVECLPTSETSHEWRRIGTSCRESWWRITTHHTDPYCGPEQCDYTTTSIEESETGQVQNAENGLLCSEELVLNGYCVQGVCVAACDNHAGTQPGCQSTPPPNAVRDEERACWADHDCYVCPDNMLWTGTACTAAEHTIMLGSVIAVAGETFMLSPVTHDHNGNPVNEPLYRYSGFRTITTTSPYEIITREDEVGIHHQVVNAYRVSVEGEELLATKIIEVALSCPAGAACCVEGAFHYQPPGTSCNEGQGFCDRTGTCQPVCTDQQHENTAARCSDGLDNDCDGVYDCVLVDDEYERGCTNHCTAFCPLGERACDAACIDPGTDHEHCGACNSPCRKDELCDQGRCRQIPGCYVACLDDDGCQDGQVCLLGGTCDAYCEDVPVLILNETATQELLTSVVRQRTVAIRKTLTDHALIIEVTNLLSVPLENLSLTVTIPKTITESASSISSDHPFTVVHDDPVIQTVLPAVRDRERVEYQFEREVDPELVENIIITADHAPINLAEQTALGTDELVITSAYHEDADGTTVTLTLDPDGILEDVRIPLEIPKCLAASISEMTFNKDNYVIVNDDPLMVWTFDELATRETIEFTVPYGINQDCRDQLKAFGMAAGKRKPVNPWLPILIIPLIGFVLLYFQQFHRTGARRHLSKKEYYENGRTLGQSEDEIERGWHEYKRKF